MVPQIPSDTSADSHFKRTEERVKWGARILLGPSRNRQHNDDDWRVLMNGQ
jgi:hypothetical protein